MNAGKQRRDAESRMVPAHSSSVRQLANALACGMKETWAESVQARLGLVVSDMFNVSQKCN